MNRPQLISLQLIRPVNGAYTNRVAYEALIKNGLRIVSPKLSDEY